MIGSVAVAQDAFADLSDVHDKIDHLVMCSAQAINLKGHRHGDEDKKTKRVGRPFGERRHRPRFSFLTAPKVKRAAYSGAGRARPVFSSALMSFAEIDGGGALFPIGRPSHSQVSGLPPAPTAQSERSPVHRSSRTIVTASTASIEYRPPARKPPTIIPVARIREETRYRATAAAPSTLTATSVKEHRRAP